MWKWFKKKNSDKISYKNSDFDDEQEDEIIVRKPIEVAERVLALLAVIGKVHQGNDSRFTDWFSENSIGQYLSNQETIFLHHQNIGTLFLNILQFLLQHLLYQYQIL